MKKNLLVVTLLLASAFTFNKAEAQRYLTYVFPSADTTANVVYANNFEVLTGNPVAKDLKMDIYEPGGMPDPLAIRPLIIYLHILISF